MEDHFKILDASSKKDNSLDKNILFTILSNITILGILIYYLG